jgi:hypothetical protein
MLMYTSCGWFFDELSGIETVQVIQYAGRCAQLAEELFGTPQQAAFIEKLSLAKSNLPEHADGGRIYQKFVQPAFVDLRKVGAHYAIRSLFEPYENETDIFCYKVERQANLNVSAKNTHEHKLAAGLARFISKITQESAVLGFAAIDRGDFNPIGGVLKANNPAAYEVVSKTLQEALSKDGDLGQVLQENLDGDAFSLSVIFRDEQQRILNGFIESEWAEAEAAFGSLYPNLMSMMRTLAKVGGSLLVPRAFYAAAEFVLNTRLRRALADEKWDPESMKPLLADAAAANVALDVPTLEYILRKRLEKLADQLHDNPSNVGLLEALDAAVGVARSLPLEVNLWKIQNVCYDLLKTTYLDFRTQAQETGRAAGPWVQHFRSLAERLSLRVPE